MRTRWTARQFAQRRSATFGLCQTACRHVAIALIAFASATRVHTAEITDQPHLLTHQSYVEDVLRKTSLQIEDPKAVFAFILNSLPSRAKIYPTENYYYFRFVYGGAQYAGNIRLEAETRDLGKVHIAYSIDFADWKDEDPVYHRVLGKADGVTVERLDSLVYRVAFGAKSVVFELNDLSNVVPPSTALAQYEQYIGPIFDDSAIRFFLVYNKRLKLFHYILDETASVSETFNRSPLTDRLLIGKRTGFAFYRDHRLARKILVGVFDANASMNNYFDGPFDQLPDNFIKGDVLRNAILEVDPSLAGKINRYGATPDGSWRYMISPYLSYHQEEELKMFHACAESRVTSDLYYACFSADAYLEESANRISPADNAETTTVKQKPRPKAKMIRKRTHHKRRR